MFMGEIKRFFPWVAAFLLCWVAPVSAEYTLVLKNGRRITVQSYREEGGMVKFHGLGGEIGIGKDQIQTILKAGEQEERGMVLPSQERVATGDGGASPGEVKDESKEKVLTPEEQRAKEEREYQTRVKEITDRLKSARDRYSLTTRGSAGPEPTLLNSEEQIRARADDLNSRLRDAQHNPAGPADAGGIQLSTPSPFTGAPPTTTELRPGPVVPSVAPPPQAYTPREKELSELRGQMNQLEKEREKLIQEMKQKGLETGSLFIE
jgi:hypothetical protein